MKTGSKTELRKSLQKLDTYKFKLFFTIVASYWVKHKFFISDQNFFNLWCELNELCHEVDESFPDQYDDRDIIMDFCQQHPYYFIDILCPDMVLDLFCEYLDDRLDILTTIAEYSGRREQAVRAVRATVPFFESHPFRRLEPPV